MSRISFKNFVICAERNINLQKKLVKCKTSKDLILLAENYGFKITSDDLNYDRTATKFGFWFQQSSINPLKDIKQSLK